MSEELVRIRRETGEIDEFFVNVTRDESGVSFRPGILIFAGDTVLQAPGFSVRVESSATPDT